MDCACSNKAIKQCCGTSFCENCFETHDMAKHMRVVDDAVEIDGVEHRFESLEPIPGEEMN